MAQFNSDLQFKNFKIESTKEEGEDLIVSGWGAYFGNIDSYNDVIERGAFTKTLSDRADRIAFCYQHDIWNPIAKIQLIEERHEGLWVVARLSAAEKDIQTKVREGILKEMSIGYRTINAYPELVDGETINHLTEIKLYEISIVTVAANPLAVISAMKAEEQRGYISGEFDRLIAIVKNENINFEIRKLKSLVINFEGNILAPAPPVTKPQEVSLKADDILKLLNNN